MCRKCRLAYKVFITDCLILYLYTCSYFQLMLKVIHLFGFQFLPIAEIDSLTVVHSIFVIYVQEIHVSVMRYLKSYAYPDS